MFKAELRKKLLNWLFEGPEKFYIQVFHIHKGIAIMTRYLKTIDQSHLTTRNYRNIMVVCIGLSMKIYEKIPISFLELQKIFNYTEIISVMHDLERAIFHTISPSWLNLTYYEYAKTPERKKIASYLLYYSIFDSMNNSSIDAVVDKIISPSRHYNEAEVEKIISDIVIKNTDDEKIPKKIEPTVIILKDCKKIGNGSEGFVYNKSGTAIKIYKTYQESGIPTFASIELLIQQTIRDKMLMSSDGICFSENYVGNIMSLFETDLRKFIIKHANLLKLSPMTYYEMIKKILFNLAFGIQALHEHNIVHCDLKPSNILLKQPDKSILEYELKISDFGLSRFQTFNNTKIVNEDECLICSIPYRPIDILLGAKHFDEKVDIWSFGCIAAELALSDILFDEDNTSDMIKQIFAVFGLPNPLDPICLLPSYTIFVNNCDNIQYYKYRFDQYPIPNDLKKLIHSCLQFSAYKRPSINDILEHEYFNNACHIPDQLCAS